MSAPLYWLSASVLTMMSAPRRSEASSPAMKPLASPLFLVMRTICWTPDLRATSVVSSLLPSSMISTSISSTPGIWRGRSARVRGKVSASLKQGI